jgi:hypothetical protein
MRKLSQKELLMEGALRNLGKLAKKATVGGLKGVGFGLKKGAQVAGGLGKAVKTASEKGGQTTWTDIGKSVAAGYEATGDFLTTKRPKLEKLLDELGLMPVKGDESFRGKGKIAVVDVIQYDYDDDGVKKPMEGGKVETRKFKYKDGKWEQIRDKQRREHAYGVELDRSDLAAADKRHPLSGKIVKHATNKGGVTYGTVEAVTEDEYAAIKPFKGSKAPGLYGKPVDEVEETTEEEANAHYGVKTEGTSQKNLLRQLTLLSR